MKRLLVLLVLGIFIPSAPAQAAGSTNDKQDAVLAELRAIHRDLRANVTAQLLIAELQLAHASVDKATDRRDSFKTQSLATQGEAQFLTAQLPRVQEAIEKTADPALKNAMTEQVTALKAQIAANSLRQQDQTEQVREAETRLRTARTEMDTLQGELDTLVKRLSPAN